MTTYSQSDLATRVLKDLGLVAPDETPASAILNDAIEVINSEIDNMAIRGMAIPNGSETAVPRAYLSALSRRLGLAVGPAFGLFSMMEAAVGIEPAERLLRQLTAQPATGSVAEANYF